MASITTRGWASRRNAAPFRKSALAAMLLSSAAATAQQTLPYVPTTILLSPAVPGTPTNASGHGVAYIFHRAADGVELLSLNVSATVDGPASLQTISSTLPFLDGAPGTTAFLPAMADNGTVVVQAGDCAADDGYDVWSYASGSWHRTAAALPSSADSDAGPYALGAGISFSATLAPTMSQPVLYSFGGMCLGPTTDAATWQENGTYTKSMLRVAPGDGSSSSDGGYTASFISSKGPAFPEAGFSFTPLSPSISNRSGVVTQQNRYVLLGGHTQQAFINMSSAAIWNLPEESWNFATVGAVRAGSSELAVKGVVKRNADVESRSGHTAILSQDGTALIILGGWVGSISQAASPQLAVLKMGDTYGDWTWEIPTQQPDGGIYGHGAAILPGNVMMVYGGYEITGSGSRAKRQSSGTGLRFLNMTSMSWTSSYSNPNYHGSPSASSGSNNDEIKKIGLGVGLGVGLAAVLGAFLVYLCYKRHLKKKRLARDETVRSLAQDASQFLHPEDDMIERHDSSAFPWTSHVWYTGGHDPYDNGARVLGYESLRNQGGYGTYQPPGLLIPRKPIPRAARGAYQPPTNLTTPGHIHPIYEADEDDPDGSKARQRAQEQPVTPTTPGYPDPFTTPTGSGPVPILVPGNRNSMTPSPEALLRRDPEVQDWQSDVDAAEALLAQMPARRNTGKRSSPSRRASMRSRASMADDERTASNVSESARSAISVPTRSASNKRNSTGPGALNLTIVTDTRVGTSSSSSSSGHTYSTAKTTFNALQAEGPSLLHRGQKPLNETPDRDDDEEDFIHIPSSPSKHKPRRSLGWLGSLRRVFSGNPNESGDSSKEDDGPRRMSLDQVSSDYEPRLVGLSGIGGAELLRRKQGRQDWDVDQKSIMDEWDIEKAIEQRLVQVMFTVPKERLRVVNAEVEKEEEVILVDPDQDELLDDEILDEKAGLVGYRDKGKGKGKQVAAEERDITMAFSRPETPPPGVGGGPEPASPERGRRLVHLPPPKDDDDGGGLRVTARDESEEPRPSLTLRTAEVVSVARPRTRVLKMVENIETKSRESSPSLG